MNIFKKISRIKEIDKLINMRSTGNPSEFADRLRVSERQLFNIIEELKTYGFPIKYDLKNKTYYYKEDFRFSVYIIAENHEKSKKIEFIK